MIQRARQILKELEQGAPKADRVVSPVPADGQVSMLDMAGNAVRQKLESLNVETMTPIEAMNALFALKQLLETGT